MPKINSVYRYIFDETIEAVQKATSFEGLESWFSRLFSLGDEKEINARLLKLKAFQDVMEYAKTVEPGSYEALSVANSLAVFRADGNLTSISEDYSSDSGYSKNQIADIAKALVADKSHREVAYSTLIEKGKSVVDSIPENIAKEIYDLIHMSHKLKSAIAEAQIEAVRKNYDDNGSPYKYDDLNKYHNDQAAIIEKWYREQLVVSSDKDGLKKEYDDKFNALDNEYKKLREKRTAEAAELIKNIEKSAAREIREQLEETNKKKEQLLEHVQKSVIDNLINLSPVSQEDAEDWFSSNVHIAKNAMARLKKSSSKYNSIEEIKADMMEFYRLAGGKIGKIQIATDGSRRANAHHSGEINIDSRFSKRTLWHEMGHTVEYGNPMIGYASIEFRDKRAKGASKVKLKKLSHSGYGNDEYALPDDFFDPYVGKVYRDGITEVVSMGLQQLSSPDRVIDLFNRDREHLELVIGMAMQPDYAATRLLDANKEAAKADISDAAKREAFEKELKRVASKAEIDDKYISGKGREWGNVPWISDSGKWQTLYYEEVEEGKYRGKQFNSIQKTRNFLYIFEANRLGLINPRTWYSIGEIEDILSGHAPVPSWFTPGQKLPKLIDKKA